jgi:hypothetical protein
MKLLSFGEFDRLKKMSLNEVNRWILSIYESAYGDGQESFAGGEMWAVPEDMLFDAVVSVKGVGSVRAQKIVEAIFKAAEVYEKSVNGGGNNK